MIKIIKEKNLKIRNRRSLRESEIPKPFSSQGSGEYSAYVKNNGFEIVVYHDEDGDPDYGNWYIHAEYEDFNGNKYDYEIDHCSTFRDAFSTAKNIYDEISNFETADDACDFLEDEGYC